jgi:hypothetical protein
MVRTLGIVLIIAALFGAAATVEHARELRFPQSEAAPPDVLYLTSGETLRRLSVGYGTLTADLYWIRTIQYYGDVKLRLTNASGVDARATYDQLYPLLDLTTTLDPRFSIAYRFGAIFLAETYPGGAGRPDLAITLLEKGLREQPDKWEYMQDAGFVNYWWKHDYKAAAAWFEKGSQVPGAPWFLSPLAATTLAEGGDRRSSRMMWETLRQSSELEWVRHDAERRLMQLDALDFIATAQPIVDRARAQTGQPFADWNSLRRAGVVRAIPVDGTGVAFEFDPAGMITVSKSSTLFPLPEEPKRIQRIPGV